MHEVMNIVIPKGESSITINFTFSSALPSKKKARTPDTCYGQTPYGYVKNKEKKLIKDDQEQAIIKTILELSKTMSKKDVCKKLMDDKIATRSKSGIWYPENIRRILKSQVAAQ